MRPKFVGVFEGRGKGHGPPVKINGCEYSCSLAGENTYAVDDMGNVYNLAQDIRNDWKLVWIRLEAPVLRLKDGEIQREEFVG